MSQPTVNALRIKHPRGEASLPAVPATPAGRILGVSLLADTLPGSVGVDAQQARVTASLAVQWARPPDEAAPARARLRRLRGQEPYLPIAGRIHGQDGRLVATTLAVFAPVPPVDRLAVPEHAGELSADLVGQRLDTAVRAAFAPGGRGAGGRGGGEGAGATTDAGTVELEPAFLNLRGILHGAVGSALLGIAASRAVMDGDRWPRMADGHVRFIRPVIAPRLLLEVDVLRRSARSADVDVRGIADGEVALLGRYLFAAPERHDVR